jgi:hypothetical protein
VAWVIYKKFPAADANAIPKGKTGALMPGGDFFEGTIRSADAAQARVMSPLFGPRTFEGQRGDLLAAVRADIKTTSSHYEVRTTGDSLFLADQITADAGKLTITRAGKIFTVPKEELASISAGAARHLPIATVQPTRVEVALGTPEGHAFILHTLPGGSPLQVGSEVFPRGIASFTQCALTWEIPAGMTTLVGRFGVAPAVPSNIRLAFAVYADGRPSFRSKPMTSAESAQSFRANLGAARLLTLRIEPQFPSNARGTGIWVEPTLLRR